MNSFKFNKDRYLLSASITTKLTTIRSACLKSHKENEYLPTSVYQSYAYSRPSVARMACSCFSDLGLTEHTNGFGMLVRSVSCAHTRGDRHHTYRSNVSVNASGLTSISFPFSSTHLAISKAAIIDATTIRMAEDAMNRPGQILWLQGPFNPWIIT